MKLLLISLAVTIIVTPAAAQIDYRNLDQGRPTAVEDAYALERYGFEVSGEYRYAGIAGEKRHLLVPELAYGFAGGVHASIRVPFVAFTEPSAGRGGLAGVDVSLFLNLSTERTGLPGLAVRLDGSVPAGVAAGSGTGVSLTGLATHSFGAQRVHLNASLALEAPDTPAEAEPSHRWWVGLAVDRTLLRSSTLLIVEGSVASDHRGTPLRYSAGLGVRRQLATTVVANVGLGVDLGSAQRTEAILTLGFSHSFGLGFLMPRSGR